MDRWLNEIVGPMKGQIANFSLPALNQLVSVIQQAAVFDWQGTLRRATHGSGGNTIVSLSSLAAIDNMGADLAAGVCPIPLYELTVDDLELFQSGADNEAIIAKLKRLGIHQYFFPPSDQVVLGLVDRGVKESRELVRSVDALPSMGHLVAPPELVNSAAPLADGSICSSKATS